MTAQRVLVITGMHRSGTSLVTGLLQQAGLDIGQTLLPGNPGNPDGHFEDTEFYNFQEQLLRDRGLDMFVTRPVDFTPTQAETERAARLIDARAGRPLWGWKDPRTSLFLDFWEQLLPQAGYVFLYRHPLDVVASLMRRGDFLENGRLEVGLQSWCVYNEGIINFFKKNNQRGVLCNIYRLIDNIDSFQAELAQKTGLALSLDLQAGVPYRPHQLMRLPINPAVENVLRHIYPPASALYRQLENLADLPSIPRAEPSASEAELSGLMAYIQALPEPRSAEQIRSAVLRLIGLTAPGIFEQFYTKISTNLYHVATERDQLRERAQVREELLQAYETRFQSQDMMTRHYLKLTANNFLDIWRAPKTVLRKINRWVNFRLKRSDQAN
jgi:hypothetical protein